MSDNLMFNWNRPEDNERLELVFENRFKNYGAYAIRKHYDKHKLIATLISCGLALGLAYSAYWYFRLHPPTAIIKNFIQSSADDVYTPAPEEETNINIPEEDESKQTQNSKMDEFMVPEPDETSRLQHTFNPNDFITRAGSFNNTDGGLFEFYKGDPGFFDSEPGGEDESKEIVFEKTDYPASYPGGEEAFVDFVKRNFVYPSSCYESGINGSVELQFIIDRSGRVSKITVTKGCKLCPEFEAEAMRVLALTDRQWIPAIQKGKAVIAWRKVPIHLDITAK